MQKPKNGDGDCDRDSREGGSYLEGSGPDKSVSAKVAANVGSDDLAIDAIARHEVHVLSRCTLCVGLNARLLTPSCHGCGCAGLNKLVCEEMGQGRKGRGGARGFGNARGSGGRKGVPHERERERER